MTEQDVFGLSGPLARVLPGWEPRPPQVTMAQAIGKTLESETGTLVVEAGTGVGKSLAYLIPAALWCVRNAKKILISTHTRALQEQLIHGDLPIVAKVLAEMGLPLKFAMLMGSDNYLCMQRLTRLRINPTHVSEEAREVLERLDHWGQSAKTGHRSHLPELVAQNLWDRISKDADICLRPSRPAWERCLWRHDRERADKAMILVVNHALLLSGARLPPYDAMIIDEAHNLEEAAVSRYGCEVSSARIVSLCDEARTTSKLSGDEALLRASDEAENAGTEFLRELAFAHDLKGREDESSGRLLIKTPEKAPMELLNLESVLAHSVAREEGRAWEMDLRALHARAAQLGHDLAEILSPSPDAARWVAWPNSGPELRAAPLDVGRRLSEGLFSRAIPVILTSATLSSGDGLGDFKSRVGLVDARELSLDSPFDYRSQAALWCVPDLPHPSDDPEHARAIAEMCEKIISRVPGGVFLLFSSWKVLKQVHGLLRQTVKNRPVWAQGNSGHDALIDQFEKAGNAVLLGVDTFWQGVDVPGEALSCVVLTKLPFGNVGSPLEEARRRWFDDNGRDYFRDWSLPKAVMKFRQGFGRLIRSGSDRGAVICLDPRIVKKGYGRFFLEALPSCRQIESLDELERFFQPVASPREPAQ